MKHLLLFILSFVRIISTDLVPGDSSDPFSFSQPITTQAYDPAGGTWYVGSATGAGSFTIAKAQRTFLTSPSFSPIAADLQIEDKFIEFLSIASQPGEIASVLIAIPRNTTTFSTTQITALNTSGSIEQLSPLLNDASGILTTEGIVNIAAQKHFVFAALRPNGGDFGEPNSGITLVQINTNNLALTTLDSVNGSSGNRARELAANSIVLKGSTGGNDVLFQAADNLNKVTTYWDDQLKRLYTGVRITTGPLPTDIGKSVVVGRLNNNALLLEAICPDSALSIGQDEIIVAEGASIGLTTKNITVLHASTGPSYLIVNGGRAESDLTGNRIRALPLVNTPNKPAEHGTIANKNTSLLNGSFVIPATVPGDLPLEQDPAAIVGSTNLPLDSDQDISQITALGDTVYVSLSNSQSNTEETGLFYSQALFDQDGKIIHWTPWTKRSFPFNGFPQEQAGIKFFAIDALTAKTWAVNGDALDSSNSNRIVRITAWKKNTDSTTLVGALNLTNLQCSACSLLDLDQSTRGFLCATPHRYALFGAPESVIFTRVSKAFQNTNIISPQQVIEDFSLPSNLKETKLGQDSGSVTVMEYARRDINDNTNYFFAGTSRGLFVFADPNGDGFNASDLSTLDMPPFSNNRWHFIDNIKGSITDIKTTGNALYILTYNTSSTKAIDNILYRIPFSSNINSMFDPANISIIARSNTESLLNTLFFSSILIISTSDTAQAEQIILATNNGLYQSTRPGGIQDAFDQADAAWVRINTNDKQFFNGTARIDNASTQIITCTGPTGPTGPIAPPSTGWTFNISDPSHCKLYNRSDINQVSGTANNIPFELTPQNFNSIETFNPDFKSLYPVSFFWSDGGRRIFIVRRPQDIYIRNRLLAMPFDTITWNVNTSNGPIIRDTLFDTFNTFYWVSLIGATGKLLAGTNNGVIALE